MFATIRRIALAAAGAAALVAAGRARADHLDRQPGFPPSVQPPAYQAEAYPVPAWASPTPVLRFTLALPAPPAWLAIAPPPVPAYGLWSRIELEREYRWLELARARFYRRGFGPWRTRQFEAFRQARRAELDRRWAELAWASARGHEWRGESWDRDRHGERRDRD